MATLNVQGQEEEVNEVLVSSPNVSSLFRAGAVPVNKSNGTMNIEVPIFSTTVHGNPINVSLNYNTQGIRVNEVASEVGLGWSLNQGGVITRDVKSRSDNVNAPYYNEIEQFKAIKSPDADLELKNRSIYATTRDISHDYFDMEPDIYSYSFDGYSGKFYLFPNGKHYTFPASPLKIEYEDMQGNGKWIITAPNGNKYFFGYNEDNSKSAFDFSNTSLSSSNTSYSSFSGVSSWFLLETKMANQEKIIYNHTFKDYGFSADISEKYKHVFIGEINSCQNGTEFTDVYAWINSFEIESINYKDLKIQFIRDLNRRDLIGANAVTSILVFRGQDQIKRYDFEYYYNTPSNPASNSSSGLGSDFTLRLFLKKITLVSNNRSEMYREFAYKGDGPSRLSRARDHWGFFNGKANTTLVPSSTYFNGTTMYAIPGIVSFEGADREADEVAAQAMILTSVKYPTGGKSEFTYESNRVKNTTTSLPAQIRKYAHVQFENRITDTTYFSVNNPVVDSSPPTADVSYSIINDDASINVNLIREGCAELILYNISSGLTVKVDKLYQQQYPTNLRLPVGNYKMYFRWPNESTSCSDINNFLFYVTLNWVENNDPVNPIISDKIVGGLRVAEIRNYDHNSQLLTKKIFKYNEDNSVFSSGYLEQDPVYTVKLSKSPCMNDVFGTDSQLPTTGTNGSIVLYNVVTELDVDGNGHESKQKSYFTTSNDYPPTIFSSLPSGGYKEINSYEWRRGLLVKDQIFSQKQNNWDLIQEKLYQYSFNSTQNSEFPSDFISGVTRAQIVNYVIYGYWEYEFTEYTKENEWIYKSKEITKTYDQGGEKTSIKNYYYGNPLHRQVTKIDENTSDLSTVSVIKSYPHEMVKDNKDPHGIYHEMITKNIIDPVVEEESFKANTQISFRRNNYGEPYPGLFLTDSIQTRSGVSSPIETLIKYQRYDAEGNIEALEKRKGPSISYLWDYKNNYPVAEIKNASNAEVAYTSFEAENKGGWSYTGSMQLNSDAPFGKKIYNLNSGVVTKGALNTGRQYILTYWANSTSAANISGGPAEKIRSYNGWVQYKRILSGVSSVQLSGNYLIDNLCLYPSIATMTTYTYDPYVGMTSKTNTDGSTTYYQYDDFQRLWRIQDQSGKVLNEYNYHYKQ
ncbi:hypothetical protein DDR33_05540 [Pararcticibacter amylolyticus]|uniref:Sugar-binding protein n=1 Tax=Pararcticibacter amylolyticus TaxID=2173175 RepID=A0A2U2PKM6_9SPHI|nr:hypothetical protein DDR33_05540 [Pararcticibacter amylolyticus]